MKPHSWDLVNLLGSFVPLKGDLIAQLVEHCTGIAEVLASNPLEPPEIFRYLEALQMYIHAFHLIAVVLGK